MNAPPSSLIDEVLSAISRTADLIEISRAKLQQIGFADECTQLEKVVETLRIGDMDPYERVRLTVPKIRGVADILRDHGFIITSDSLRIACVEMASAADRLLTTTQPIG